MTASPIGHSLYSQSNGRRLEFWTWASTGSGPFRPLFLLHGVNDAGGFGWWQQGRVHETADQLTATRAIEPVVLIMASDTGVEHGSAYCDWADGTAASEAHIIHELLPWVRNNLSTHGLPMIAGLSMGGYGALLLALRHPGTFASASSMSGFFSPRQLLEFAPADPQRMWGDTARERQHDVQVLVQDKRRSERLRILFDCGTSDGMLSANREFAERLRRLHIAHRYDECPGGHTWEYWKHRFARHLRFHAPLVHNEPHRR